MTARPATVLVSPILPLWVGWQEAMRTAAGEGGDRKGPRHGHCRTRGTRWTRAEGGRERQSCPGGWCRSRGDQQSYAVAAASPPRGPTTVDATYRVQTRTHLLSHVQGARTHIMCVHAPTDACARIQAVRDKKKYRPIVFYRRGSMRATEPSLTR